MLLGISFPVMLLHFFLFLYVFSSGEKKKILKLSVVVS